MTRIKLIINITIYSILKEKISTQIKIPSHPDKIVHRWVFCIKWENAIIKHINGPIKPDEIAIQMPHDTANDLPPLNLKKGEKILPEIAAKHKIANWKPSKPKIIAK